MRGRRTASRLPFAAREVQRERNPTGANSTGAMMKLSLRYKNIEEHEPVEKEVAKRGEKLGRLLKCYDGDLVRKRGAQGRVHVWVESGAADRNAARDGNRGNVARELQAGVWGA
jgi:hypothetical protein